MRKAGWGRIVNNTTSFRTMLRVLPYGATKSALESMSAVWADELKDKGITVNVLIPGGPTDTPFVSDEAGWPREQMLRPAIMGPPAVWLMSEASNGFTGKRVTAADWDATRPADEAALGGVTPHRLARPRRPDRLVAEQRNKRETSSAELLQELHHRLLLVECQRRHASRR